MRLRLFPLLVALAVWLAASQTYAHIRLLQPPSWVQEDGEGDPQKIGPCGTSAASPGTPTNVVTTYRAGQTITVQWLETIYHPGHFRVALARDRNELVDPEVMADSSGVSLSAKIAAPPAYPVLLDGLYARTGSGKAGMTFTQEVTLPNTPCEKCTLQVIQFMAQHGEPYVYHHCADLKIVAGDVADAGGSPVGSSDAGVRDAAADAARAASDGSASEQEEGDGDDDGCALSHHRSQRVGPLLILLGLALALGRRRKHPRAPGAVSEATEGE